MITANTITADDLDTFLAEDLGIALDAEAYYDDQGEDAISGILEDHQTMRRAVQLLLVSDNVDREKMRMAFDLARSLR